MSKNILILTGSPRPNGNSFILADAFAKGAEAAGHTVRRFDTAPAEIDGCRACNQCFKHGNACVFDDDFNILAPRLEEADVLVLATPLYWFSFPSQLKAALDKLYSLRVGKRSLNIRECVLDEIVLEDIRQVTALAREQTQAFAAYICDRQSAELRREIRRQELELSAMQKRSAELEAIFKRLYEDSVLGRITVEQFQSLSASYVAEQEQIKTAIPEKERAATKLKATVSGTDNFISKAKRYTDISELTPELLRLFIEKIVVHEKDVKWSKHARQTVEIHYTDIGVVGSLATVKSA